MATPSELGLIKSGIDTVIKIQTKNGANTAFDMAPAINHREGYYRAAVITGFGDATQYGMGVSVPSDRKQSLYVTDFYPKRFAKAWEYAIQEKDQDVYREMASNAADIATAMRRRKNKEAANLFCNNGFSSVYPIYDGQPLYSTAHPGVSGVTGSNTPASGNALGILVLEDVIGNYFGQTDPRGESLEFEGNLQMWVGNMKYLLAMRLAQASQIAQSPDNDPNVVKRFIDVKRGDKITSTTAHFYKASSEQEHGLRTIVFSPYRVTEGVEARSEVTVMVVSEQYNCVALKWNGTYGDPGV